MPIRLSDYLKKEYGEKVYRLSLSSGCICPNRDGSIYYDIKSDEYHISNSYIEESGHSINMSDSNIRKTNIEDSNTKESNVVDFDTFKSNIAVSDIGESNDCIVRLTGGCTFCSEGGSGEFAAGNRQTDNNFPDIDSQIEFAKKVIQKKTDAKKFIAYFQSFTNTYGNVRRLSELYHRAISRDEIVALSIGTRPDCIGDDILDMLKELNTIKPVWIELGLQTIHEDTAKRINRGYKLKTFEDTYFRLKKAGITVIVHVILGLPGESREDMLETVKYLSNLNPPLDGIKLQNLQILKGTKMYEELKVAIDDPEKVTQNDPAKKTQDYFKVKSCIDNNKMKRTDEHDNLTSDFESSVIINDYHSMTMEEYTDLVAECIALLPKECVVHRMTGDGPRKLLVDPLWSLDKKRVLNMLSRKTGKYFED